MAEKDEIYLWEGTNRQGQKAQGELAGPSVTVVKAMLRRQGVVPSKVRKKPQPLFGIGGEKVQKITTKDIAVFSRQLATMVAAGIPLVQSMDIVARGHDNPTMASMLLEIKADVEAGSNLADALRKHPKEFDDLYCNLIAAGEQAGILETLLNKIAEYKEKTELVKAKIKKALTYPISVVAVAFIVTAILLIFVVPQFQDLFKGFGADLPAFTLFVIGLSEAFQAWWWAIFGGVGAAIYGFVTAREKSQDFYNWVDETVLKLPVVGMILHKSAIARFARTLSTMFAAGVPLVEAMDSVAKAAGNVVYSDAISRMREDIATGQPLQQAMTVSGLFPNLVVQMVAVGEETGALDSMLGKVADFYEEEVDDAVDNLSSLMEPLIMSVLGVLVGGLIIAMYLPIFKMGAVV